ncbi:MAG: TonB-dependent receptor plug domain-containing protein, partial [Gemmobacter sp.]
MIRLNQPPRRGLSLNGLLLSGVAGLALCAATATQAQEISLDPIIVEQADEQSGAADRATTQYVSQAELERARTGNLKDLFSGIASVAVGGAVPVAQKIFVNGVDMLNLAVTLDGVAQNNRAFHHVSANAIDPGLLKAARADAGAAPADAGPHAIAGSVVFETVDAADILAEDAVFGGDLRLAYGENGKTFTRALTLATRHAGFEALAYAKSATGSDYTTGGGETIAGTAADLQSGLLKLAYEAPEGHRFELSGMVLADDALRRYRANIGEVIGGRPVPELRRYDTERRNLSFSYENTQAEGLWDPKLVIGLSENLINIPDPELSEGRSRSVSGTLQNTFHLSETDTVVA